MLVQECTSYHTINTQLLIYWLPVGAEWVMLEINLKHCESCIKPLVVVASMEEDPKR